MNNSRIVSKWRRCLDLNQRITDVGPRALQYTGQLLARAGKLIPDSSSIVLDVPLASVMLAIVRKFFRNANLYWVNVESCSTARLTGSYMDRRRTNNLLGLGRDIISTMITMFTGNCSHLTTFARNAGPLRKRRLFSTFFVSAHLSRYADIDY